MTALTVINLLRDNMGAPVRLNSSPDGAATQKHGVTAVIELRQGLGWGVLADHPLNPGVSVTNGAQMYAEAVCLMLKADLSDIVWFELDSDGRFDVITLLAERAIFEPLVVEGLPPGSMDSLLARLSGMGRPPTKEASDLLQALYENFDQ